MEPRLSELLWEHDPNGLLVVDRELRVTMVNPAFCSLFDTTRDEALGRPAAEIIGDTTDLEHAFTEPATAHRGEQACPDRDLHIHRIIFSVPEEQAVAAIFIDLTGEWKQRGRLQDLQDEVAREVRDVVDRQMAVAQEIAGLLGETTAETKVALLRLLDTIRRDHG